MKNIDLKIILITIFICFILLLIPPFSKTPLGGNLAILLIILLPGYAISAAVFPKKQYINLTERLGLSLILSLSLNLLVALIMGYRDVNIVNLTPLSTIILILTIYTATVTYMIRSKIEMNERFDPDITASWNNLKGFVYPDGNHNDKLRVILIILLLASTLTTIYIVVNPNPGESFTEFYILGHSGLAADYPTNITLGQNGNISIGIVSHENKEAFYLLIIRSNGKNIGEMNITLQNDQKIEIPYNITPSSIGNKKIEFLLYKQPDKQTVYQSLQLFVNVNNNKINRNSKYVIVR